MKKGRPRKEPKVLYKASTRNIVTGYGDEATRGLLSVVQAAQVLRFLLTLGTSVCHKAFSLESLTDSGEPDYDTGYVFQVR